MHHNDECGTLAKYPQTYVSHGVECEKLCTIRTRLQFWLEGQKRWANTLQHVKPFVIMNHCLCRGSHLTRQQARRIVAEAAQAGGVTKEDVDKAVLRINQQRRRHIYPRLVIIVDKYGFNFVIQ